MKRLAYAFALTLAACTDSGSDDADLYALDEAAAAAEADGKADSVLGLVRLERTTTDELAAAFKKARTAELGPCFTAYKAKFDPAATRLTKAVTAKFIDVAIASDNTTGACANWFDLGETVNGILDANGVTGYALSTVNGKIAAWALPQIQAATVEGFVATKTLPILFYSDLVQLRDANAIAREQDPSGIDLAAIRTQWDQVKSWTTLDRAYLNPVTFAAGALDGDRLFQNLRAAFPLTRLSLVSTGHKAIDNFASAHEGPENDPAFAPIASAFKKGSIKKRFYFAGGGSEWSSNVLIVVDHHGQAYGMQMGYSE